MVPYCNCHPVYKLADKKPSRHIRGAGGCQLYPTTVSKSDPDVCHHCNHYVLWKSDNYLPVKHSQSSDGSCQKYYIIEGKWVNSRNHELHGTEYKVSL